MLIHFPSPTQLQPVHRKKRLYVKDGRIINLSRCSRTPGRGARWMVRSGQYWPPLAPNFYHASITINKSGKRNVSVMMTIIAGDDGTMKSRLFRVIEI